MAKISVSSKKNKTKKTEMTGVDVGLLKVKDGRIHKKKTGKRDVVTDILSSNIKEASQGTLTKPKSKKARSSSLNSNEFNTNGALVTSDHVSATENRETSMVNPFPKGKTHIRSLDQSVGTKDSSVSINPLTKVAKDTNVETSEGAPILPSRNPTDGQRKQKVRKDKLGRLEKLRVIEETRKKKQKKINLPGTTKESSLNNTKISLDDLLPDLDDDTDTLPIPHENRKSRKLSKKAEAVNRSSFEENMGDSDTDSDEDAKEDEAVCKSYKNDFGFDKVVDAVLQEKNREEDRLEEEKLQEAANKKKKTERDVTEHERTIEVINVHIKTSKKLLLSLFKKFGKVESIRYRNIPVEHAEKFRINQIMKNTLDKKRLSMTAFVKFANTEAAKSALDANCTEVNGHHIIVRPCVRQSPHQQREELSKGCTVLLGNLPHVTEEESVYKHFESCGSIVNISIIRNQFKATGTAFLQFKTKEAAAAALKLNDTELQRRIIRVTKAVRKVKANKKHVQSSISTNTRSPSGGGGNKAGGRPFPGKAGAHKPFAPNKQKPFQRAPGAFGKGPQNVVVKPGSVQSRLSRPGQQQAATTASSTPSGTFTGSKFDQSQKGEGKLLKKKRTKDEVKKIMLAKKLTFKKPSQ